MRMTCLSEVHSNRFLGVDLTLLGCTAKMFTEPGLSWSAGTANVLRTSELSTHSSLLGTGHTVDDTCSITGDGALDGVGLPCEVAGVPDTVSGVGAHTAVSSLAALLKSLPGLPSSLPVVGWRDLGSH